MGALGKSFRFSQTALSTFYTCRRRFWLRYVRRVQWPAMLTDQMAGWERAIERGSLFHRWIHQESVGIDLADSVRNEDDAVLQRWWENWCSTPPALPEGTVYSEIQLSAPILSHRLVAQFDRLIVTESGRMHIADWKTGLKAPVQSVFDESWQTRVYLYVAVEAGRILVPNALVNPSDVVLSYWHANAPSALRDIPYSEDEHERVRDVVEQSVAEICALPNEMEAFSKCEDRVECTRCAYAVLCDRGCALVDAWEGDTANAVEEIEDPW